MKNISILTLLFVSGVVSASGWGYGEDNGPDKWGKVSKLCMDGKNQSPINLGDTVSASHQELDLDYSGEVTQLYNNGHTLQAAIEGDNTLLVDGMQFDLKQFHFHTPSENLIRDRSYPLEAHFVHADSEGNLAVVSVMYEIDTENSEIGKLSKTLPSEGTRYSLQNTFAVADMLPDYHSFYRYNGSLTTPPCSEGVRWFVLTNTQSLSQAQAKKLNDIMGDNNRPVQSLWARQVMFTQ
ncbi:carbonic anhydrase [Vibrio sp. WXL210]|uniref:carbonic anhydrase n=1 Tax=Vibrio sp. WXL210 TaxID=3450709 RepID=UPI003EC4FE77